MGHEKVQTEQQNLQEGDRKRIEEKENEMRRDQKGKEEKRGHGILGKTIGRNREKEIQGWSFFLLYLTLFNVYFTRIYVMQRTRTLFFTTKPARGATHSI